jgi:hypothetical protein
LFLIGRFKQISETAWPNKPKLAVAAPHVTPALLLVNDASMVAKEHAEIFIYLIGHKTQTRGEDISVAKIVSMKIFQGSLN